MNKSHNRRPFGKAKVNRWIKRYTHKRYRGRINQIVNTFAKHWHEHWWDYGNYADYGYNEDYEFYYPKKIPDPLDEPHLPLWKDINNPWNWD